eukprot:CAMPEP_0114333604 /NCGR_PEP_ID=MMETSP0101-20121206/3860_1 /TAXON_ID=38822 ORGANISM="Pteridomonas danica, Strain PT" /NCGR_SAMPLE_ID=MMETSP0101 /ASSEMBLY_ACC=CAM_ASM_000211 /LENGTH=137 /DNA_ID=CAMNT_0001464667 /DNA_START=107 /DNA_END=520 /DNA_ORIENTATION=+
MAEGPVSIRERKYIRNPLLNRRQFILEIIHPGKANLSRAEIAQQLMKRHKVESAQCVVTKGFRSSFGGGKSVGFVCIYDNLDSMKKFEHKFQAIRAGLTEKTESSRKQIKEAKNRGKKTRGTGVRIAKHKAKRTQDS